MTLYDRRSIAALLIALFALLCCCAARAETPADYDMNAPQNLKPEHLYAESALLVDEDSGEVLFSKNARVRMFPASTTKIMTLLLALESGIPLDSQVVIPPEAADVPEGSSVVPVKPGDEMSFSDLLYGFMLSSGNDGANAIAVLVDGSIPAFVERMNRRADELGCEGTHYVNAHGYHDAQHYTTAQDLVRLSIYAMQNDDFRKIVAAPKWTMSIRRNGGETTQDIISRNSLLQSGEKYYYPDCTGIKTGHHSKAGWCFVGSAQRDGMRVICAVLNCEREDDKWYDAARLFEYGFTRYSDVSASSLLDRTWERFAQVRVADAAADDAGGGELSVSLVDVEGGERTVKVVSDSNAALSALVERLAADVDIEWQRELAAPIAEGERLGTVTVTLPDGSPVTAGLAAARAVAVMATPEPSVVPTAVASTPEQTAEAAPRVEGRARQGSVILPVALALLLIAACMAVALALYSANKRRARRQRRRKRSAAANRGTRTNQRARTEKRESRQAGTRR